MAARRRSSRRLSEQRVEGRDKPIAIPPQGRQAVAQGLVLRQPFEQLGFLLLVELIVDQSGQSLLVVRHSRTLLFQFRQRAPHRGEPAHDRADRNPKRGRRLGVGIAFGVHQEGGFALGLGQTTDGG